MVVMNLDNKTVSINGASLKGLCCFKESEELFQLRKAYKTGFNSNTSTMVAFSNDNCSVYRNDTNVSVLE